MEDDENQLTPVITDDGYTFLYVKHNNLYRQRIGRLQGGGRACVEWDGSCSSTACTIRVCTQGADSRSFHRALAVVLSAVASIL